jgi:hypothetical protein
MFHTSVNRLGDRRAAFTPLQLTTASPAQMFSNTSRLRMVKRNKFRAPGRATAEDEFGNKIRRAAGRLSQWHAETEKIFGVHLTQPSPTT